MRNLFISNKNLDEINILPLIKNKNTEKKVNEIIENNTNYNTLKTENKNNAKLAKNSKSDIIIIDNAFFQNNKKLLKDKLNKSDIYSISYIFITDNKKLKNKNSDLVQFINKNQEYFIDILKTPFNSSELKIKINNINKFYQKNKKYDSKNNKLIFFKKAIDNIGKAVYITDTNGYIKYVNNTFEDITGYNKNEIIEKNASILETEEEKRSQNKLLEKIFSKGIHEEKIINKKKSGEFYRAKQTILPIRYNSKRKGLLIIQTDITRNKLIKEQLNVLHRVLKHNMRNDVSTIQVYIDIINENTQNQEIKQATEKIKETSEKMENLGEKAKKANKALTSLSRPIDLPVKIKNIIKYTKKDIKSKYPESSIIANTPKENIKVDYILQTALEEIIENAVIHNTKKPKIKININKEPQQKMIYISIKDNGPGLPKEQERFLNKERKTRQINGRGIGLWLVYWIVKSLGGKISIENNKKKGTTVNLQIPILKQRG